MKSAKTALFVLSLRPPVWGVDPVSEVLGSNVGVLAVLLPVLAVSVQLALFVWGTLSRCASGVASLCASGQTSTKITAGSTTAPRNTAVFARLHPDGTQELAVFETSGPLPSWSEQTAYLIADK